MTKATMALKTGAKGRPVMSDNSQFINHRIYDNDTTVSVLLASALDPGRPLPECPLKAVRRLSQRGGS
jgi:hypothetical protein